jgi:Tfp pilus assembly protein PilF
LQAQPKAGLIGYVTVQNTGKPVYPAIIRSTGASDGETSSTDGRFELQYGLKSAGQDVIIEVIPIGFYQNYEIVYPEACYVKLPIDPIHQRPVKIVMCPSGEWERNAKKWNTNNVNQIVKQYNIKIETIKKRYVNDLKVKERELAIVKFQRDSAIKFGYEYAVYLAKTDLSHVSTRYLNAIESFKSGDLNKSLQILQEDSIQADIDAGRKTLAKATDLLTAISAIKASAEERIDKGIEEYMLRANICFNKLDWVGASKAYDLAMANDTTNYRRALIAANFYSLNHEKNKAIKIYYRAIKLAPSKADSIALLSTLSLQYVDIGKIKEMGKIQQNIREFYQHETSTDSIVFLGKKAQNLTLLGLTSGYEERSNKTSFDLLGQAINIYDKLKTKTDFFLLGHYLSLNIVSAQLNENGKTRSADSVFKRSLEILNCLYKRDSSNSDLLTLDHAGYETLFAIKETKAGHVKNADTAYRKAIKYWAKLDHYWAADISPEQANAMVEYGIFLKKHGRLDSALNQFHLSIRMYLQLQKIDPINCRPGLANAYNELGELIYSMSTDSAAYYHQQALKIYSVLANEDELEYMPNVISTLGKISHASEGGNFKEAIEYQLKALGLAESLVKKSKSFLPDLADTYYLTGLLYFGGGIDSTAIKYIKNAINISENLDQESKALITSKLVVYYNAVCTIDEFLLSHAFNIAYIEDGKKYSSRMFALTDSLPSSNENKVDYKKSAFDYKDFYNNIDETTLEWLKDNKYVKIIADNLIKANSPIDKTKIQTQLVQLIELFLDTTIPHAQLGHRISDRYFDLSWYSLIARRPDLSLKAIEKAKFYKASSDIDANLALALAYSERHDESINIYKYYKGKINDAGKQWNDVFEEDLNYLEKIGYSNPYKNEIMRIITNN